MIQGGGYQENRRWVGNGGVTRFTRGVRARYYRLRAAIEPSPKSSAAFSSGSGGRGVPDTALERGLFDAARLARLGPRRVRHRCRREMPRLCQCRARRRRQRRRERCRTIRRDRVFRQRRAVSHRRDGRRRPRVRASSGSRRHSSGPRHRRVPVQERTRIPIRDRGRIRGRDSDRRGSGQEALPLLP